jgi:hypothetical protein
VRQTLQLELAGCHQQLIIATTIDLPPLLRQLMEGKVSSLQTSGGLEKNPYFFNGMLQNPKRTADILLVLSAISRTRFFSPGLIRERMLAAADPVVTCDGGQLRFEVFFLFVAEHTLALI